MYLNLTFSFRFCATRSKATRSKVTCCAVAVHVFAVAAARAIATNKVLAHWALRGRWAAWLAKFGFAMGEPTIWPSIALALLEKCADAHFVYARHALDQGERRSRSEALDQGVLKMLKTYARD